jgi:hypothetical protein
MSKEDARRFVSRREFIGAAALGGVSLAVAAALGACGRKPPSPESGTSPSPEQLAGPSLGERLLENESIVRISGLVQSGGVEENPFSELAPGQEVIMTEIDRQLAPGAGAVGRSSGDGEPVRFQGLVKVMGSEEIFLAANPLDAELEGFSDQVTYWSLPEAYRGMFSRSDYMKLPYYTLRERAEDGSKIKSKKYLTLRNLANELDFGTVSNMVKLANETNAQIFLATDSESRFTVENIVLTGMNVELAPGMGVQRQAGGIPEILREKQVFSGSQIVSMGVEMTLDR